MLLSFILISVLMKIQVNKLLIIMALIALIHISLIIISNLLSLFQSISSFKEVVRHDHRHEIIDDHSSTKYANESSVQKANIIKKKLLKKMLPYYYYYYPATYYYGYQTTPCMYKNI